MKFNKDGILDSGIHKMTWKEFYGFFSFSPKRKELLDGLEQVLEILREIENIRIYIDGSFVTSKLEPGDWDACFDCLPSQIDVLKEKYPLFDIKEQKKLYGGELYFANTCTDAGRSVSFLNFFQLRKEKTTLKKGIVELIK